MGELLQSLSGDARGCLRAGVRERRDVDGEAAGGACGGCPVVLEQEGEGLLKVEEVGGSCAWNEECFGEFPLELAGDFAGDGVGCESGGEGDVVSGERVFRRGCAGGIEESSSGGGGAEIVGAGSVGAECDGAWQASDCSIDGE